MVTLSGPSDGRAAVWAWAIRSLCHLSVGSLAESVHWKKVGYANNGEYYTITMLLMLLVLLFIIITIDVIIVVVIDFPVMRYY